MKRATVHHWTGGCWIQLPHRRAIWPAWRQPASWRPDRRRSRIVLGAAFALVIAAALWGACLAVALVSAGVP